MSAYLRPVGSGYLQSIVSPQKWEFLYCSNGCLYQGNLCGDEIKTNAADLETDVSEYSDTCERVFSDSGGKELEINIEETDSGCFELSWKKVANAFIKYSLGSVVLKQCKASEMNNLLENCTEQMRDLKNQLEISQNSFKNLEEENKALVERMEKMADQKLEMESELFAKFVLILNEKKAKIRSLKGIRETVKEIPDERSMSSELEQPTTSKALVKSVPKSKPRKRTRKAAAISYDSDTE